MVQGWLQNPISDTLREVIDLAVKDYFPTTFCKSYSLGDLNVPQNDSKSRHAGKQTLNDHHKTGPAKTNCLVRNEVYTLF
jgi:hypothetical protein